MSQSSAETRADGFPSVNSRSTRSKSRSGCQLRIKTRSHNGCRGVFDPHCSWESALQSSSNGLTLKQLMPVFKATASLSNLWVFLSGKLCLAFWIFQRRKWLSTFFSCTKTTLFGDHIWQVLATSYSCLRKNNTTLQHLSILSSFSGPISLTISTNKTVKYKSACLSACHR